MEFTQKGFNIMNMARILSLACICVFSFSQANAQSTQIKGPAKVVSLGLATGSSGFIQGRAALIVRFNEGDLASTDTASNSSHCNPPNQFFIYKDSQVFAEAFQFLAEAQKNEFELEFEINDVCEHDRGREIVSVFYSQVDNTIEQCGEGYSFSEGECRTPIGCIAPELEWSGVSGERPERDPVTGEEIPRETRRGCTAECFPPALVPDGPGRCTALFP